MLQRFAPRPRALVIYIAIVLALFSSAPAQAQHQLLSDFQVTVLGDTSAKVSWKGSRSGIYFWYRLEFINLTSGGDEIHRRSTFKGSSVQINDLRPGTDYKVILRAQPYWWSGDEVLEVVTANFSTTGARPPDQPRSHYQTQIDSLISGYSPKLKLYSHDDVRVDLQDMRDLLQPVGSYTHASISASSTDNAHAFTDLAVPIRSSREMALTNLLASKEYDLTVKMGISLFNPIGRRYRFEVSASVRFQNFAAGVTATPTNTPTGTLTPSSTPTPTPTIPPSSAGSRARSPFFP